MGLVVTDSSGFFLVPTDNGKITLFLEAPYLDPPAPRSSELKRIRPWLYSIVISMFLTSCTLGPGVSERLATDTSKETPKGLSGDALAKAQRADSDKPGPNTIARGALSYTNEKKISEVDEDQEIAALKIDLSNLKDRLVTLRSAEVIDLMGRPEFERSEPPARIWQYRAPTCVMDLFLYDGGEDFVVEYVDLRTRGSRSDEVDDRNCFASRIQKLAQNIGEAGSDVKQGARGTLEVDTEVP